jgi:hypothetical protein
MAQTKVKAGGFDVDIISGTTALAETPASTDEMIISDGGTLKRLDMTHMMTRPAFFATLSADTTISDDTVTKVAANTELFDTDSAYDNSTNYRFTPGVAGKYYIFGYMQVNCSSGELTQAILSFKKNGSTVSEGELNLANSSGFRTGISNATVVDMDDDDYVEMYAMGNVGSGSVSLKSDSNTKTCFGGYKIIT